MCNICGGMKVYYFDQWPVDRDRSENWLRDCREKLVSDVSHLLPPNGCV